MKNITVQQYTYQQLILGSERREVNTMYWITGILGAALLAAPFVLGFTDNAPGMWTSMLIGVGVMFVSIMEGFAKEMEGWEYWTAEILGIVAIFAPFLFGFSTNPTAMWTTLVTGMLIAFFAGSKLLTHQPGQT